VTDVNDGRLRIGEGLVGSGVNEAHLGIVLGSRAVLGTAWSTALATPRAGHPAFIVLLQPGVAVKPFTLFVNTATIAGDAHAEMTWGAAQAGVARGVTRAVADGYVPEQDADEVLLIAAAWVDPMADDPRAVFDNNGAATHRAIVNAVEERPRAADLAALHDEVYNSRFDPRG
jgi:5,6,7,8-tetrahydromethanopterin hydro-lyase